MWHFILSFYDCSLMLKPVFKMIVFNGATEEFLLSEVYKMAGIVTPVILSHGIKDFFFNYYFVVSFSVICCIM